MRHDLPQPFHVLATQNPLEQEGTYPLPEAQLDRFLDADRHRLPRYWTPNASILLDTTGIECRNARAQGVIDRTKPS